MAPLTVSRQPGVAPIPSAEIFSLFTEDNIALTESTMLTPALRFDHHSIVGNNWSPSLNLSQGCRMTGR
ncbi:TonB-dependent receptor [Klebsiella michiganensis]|nr:TonB-dependent receptor [Klebsiella michiganensis]